MLTVLRSFSIYGFIHISIIWYVWINQFSKLMSRWHPLTRRLLQWKPPTYSTKNCRISIGITT